MFVFEVSQAARGVSVFGGPERRPARCVNPACSFITPPQRLGVGLIASFALAVTATLGSAPVADEAFAAQGPRPAFTVRAGHGGDTNSSPKRLPTRRSSRSERLRDHPPTQGPGRQGRQKAWQSVRPPVTAKPHPDAIRSFRSSSAGARRPPYGRMPAGSAKPGDPAQSLLRRPGTGGLPAFNDRGYRAR